MNTANVPTFTAERSLFKATGRYRTGRQVSPAPGHVVVPAIPMCQNCDAILERCEMNGWRPRAVCEACASGYCYEEPPMPDPYPDPFGPLPRF
jgi:hypothetical protein